MAFSMEHRSLDHVYDPVWNAASSSFSTKDLNVSGSSRFKFFENPKSTYGQQTQCVPEYKLAPESETSISDRVLEKTSRSIGIQTDYRDSETQTDPYSPVIEFEKIDKNEKTELLTLQQLTYGNGLPATDREIVRIIRAKERREESVLLPPIIDEETANIHKNFLVEQEKKDFKIREDELDEMIDVRIEAFRRKTIPANNKDDLKFQRRLEAIKLEANQRRDTEISRIRRKQMNSHHKITKRMCNDSSLGGFQKGNKPTNNPKYTESSKFSEHKKTPPHNNCAENIDTIEQIVRSTGLNLRPQRPKMNVLGSSAQDRRALPLSADLHLWDGLIKSEDEQN